MTTQIMATTAAARQRPAQRDQRAQASNRRTQCSQRNGSMAETASRVAGSAPPKITMP
jgi:hypothetical protein